MLTYIGTDGSNEESHTYAEIRTWSKHSRIVGFGYFGNALHMIFDFNSVFVVAYFLS